jgi:hypothetical protein
VKLARRLARLEANNESAPDCVLRVPAAQIHDEATVLEAIAEHLARTERTAPLILLPQRMTFEAWVANYRPRELTG